MREPEVMSALSAYLRRTSGADTLLVPELGLCQMEARIDLAVVNGHLTGWEIKTGADTLTRLPRQEPVYSKIFDRVWLAADVKHLEPAKLLVPDWWGICAITSLADGTVSFKKHRGSRLNRHVDLHSLVRLLWRDEAYEELRALGLGIGMERAPRRILWTALAGAAPAHVSPAQLRLRVRDRLKTRRGWRSDAQRR